MRRLDHESCNCENHLLTLLLTILVPMQLLADYVLEWRSPDSTYLTIEYPEEVLFHRSLLDIDGDGIAEIPLKVRQDGLGFHFLFYDGADYSLAWSYTSPGREVFYGFADVDGDGTKEAFLGYDPVIAVDLQTRLVEWEFEGSCEAIFDFDNDGHEEIVLQVGGYDDGHVEIWGCDTINAVLDEPQKSIPVKAKLSQNYPNPFNPATTIRFQVQKTGSVKLSIYNSVGQLVRTLVDETKKPGDYTVRWDGRNHHGAKVASGTYFYQLTVGDFTSAKKAILLK